MHITRGFKGKARADAATRDRVPPGQFVTSDFPILTAGPTQRTALDDWTLSFQLGGKLLARWDWNEFEALPQSPLAELRLYGREAAIVLRCRHCDAVNIRMLETGRSVNLDLSGTARISIQRRAARRVRPHHNQCSFLNRIYKPRQIDIIAPTTIAYP